MPFDVETPPQIHDDQLPGLTAILDETLLPQLVERSSPGWTAPSTCPELRYIRYKYHRRAIGLFRAATQNNPSDHLPLGYSDQPMFVATALTRESYAKQKSKRESAACDNCIDRSIAIDNLQLIIDLFPNDRAIPGLQRCLGLDDRGRKRILGIAGLPRSAFSLLAYKPARRCVFQVKHATLIQPLLVKLYTKDVYTQNAGRMETLGRKVDLWPQPKSRSPQYSALVYPWQPGRVLLELASEYDQMPAILEEVGKELARLHTNNAPSPAVEQSLAIDPSRLIDLARDIGVISSEFGRTALKIAYAVTSRLALVTPNKVLIHGDFNANQVIADKSRIHFIDFDEAGYGDRYQDVANFVAQLAWSRINGQVDAESASLWSDHFIQGYRQASGEWDEARFQTQRAAALLRCSIHPFRYALQNWHSTTHELLEIAMQALRLGNG